MSDLQAVLPNDEEIEVACRACVLPGEPGYNGNAGALRKLFERTALRSQIEVLEAIPTSDPIGFNSADAEVYELLVNRRARLAELEGR